MPRDVEPVDPKTTALYETCINDLLGAVEFDTDDADEYNVLARIMVRAGAAWRCIKCDGINRMRNATCDNCEARRPKERDVPRRESLHWEKE